MSDVISSTLEVLKQAVEDREEREPNKAVQTFSFVLDKPEQISVGSEIRDQFVAWLKARFPKRTVRSDGYPDGGYKIMATVHN
ncbi:hypothetical protein [Pseudomonas mediterranea]|uniref:Uncharacterized protein n=1 Tax=Pseudomonas mediterranea TaxID=183795 RepID=A0AAX2DEA9_9PSED|nr:hypothetical protein [Pseudomonas mediterranea]KGU87209.1 hypothetical protein N005_01245 [Pseudomonas mediterranea CFBP 5447]SDU61643.1 hypothetical protein SAMN05216476_3670 [Pseudomonas mediterranea]